MIVDVGDPVDNIVLNTCLFGIAVVTILSVFPWRIVSKKSRWPLYLPLAAIALFVIYESTMPPNWDIRLDLFIIFPMALIIATAWLIRFVMDRR